MVSTLASSAGTESNLILDHYPHPRGPPLRLRTLPPKSAEGQEQELLLAL